MADFAAPEGPPPPKVPAGWKAVWNTQYNEWFYVNVYTKKSTWERPTEPVYPPSGDDGLAPHGPPPSYGGGMSSGGHPPISHAGPEKPHYDSTYGGGQSGNLSSDEAYARKLQAEEDARAAHPAPQGGAYPPRQDNRGAQDDYYGGSSGTGGLYPTGASNSAGGRISPAPPQQASKGGLSGLLGKLGGHSSSSQPHYGQQPMGYGQPQYGQPMGYGQQGMMAQRPGGRMGGGGMGMGGAALGLGGGLLGGMLIGDMIGDAGDGGGDGGGDDGGGDYGGGDGGGGDFGGGDMGGGDMGGGDF